MQEDNEKETEENSKPITEELFRQVYHYERPKSPTCIQRVRNQFNFHCVDLLYRILPILQWFPAYKYREDLVHDIIAGATVAVVHIPQGLAYALLGGVPPIVGIYMAFFPVFVYVLMGTSRHISTGPFAVLCIMVGNTITKYSTPTEGNLTATYTSVEVATAVTLVVGLYQTLLGVLKLGFVAVLFSETLVSGFTTGVAVHVITSQVKSLVGAEMKKQIGPLKIIYTYVDLFSNIKTCNWVTVLMSMCFISVLLIFNELIRPFMQRKCGRCNIPIPIELLVIIAGTVLSVTLNLEQNYGIIVVGHIPTGLPSPTVPPVALLDDILIDGLVYAMVAIAMNLSLAKMFARKFNYEINANQELLAYGIGNVFGSFFSCMPYASSLSRSLISQTSGGRTQLTSALSCILLLLVLLFIGPVFEPLPHCILSCIVVVALKGMLFQVKDFFKVYKTSKLEGLIWLSTFLSVVIIDLDYGLGIGLLVTIITMLIRSQKPKIINLGQVPDTDIYLDTRQFKSARQLSNILILKILGGLNFANCDQIRVNIIKAYTKFTYTPRSIHFETEKTNESMSVILDLTSVPYIDPAVCKSLLVVSNDLKKSDTVLYLCHCNVSVYNYMENCKFFESFPKEHVFPTIHDAVECIEKTKKF